MKKEEEEAAHLDVLGDDCRLLGAPQVLHPHWHTPGVACQVQATAPGLQYVQSPDQVAAKFRKYFIYPH